jgi:hypothetical protein
VDVAISGNNRVTNLVVDKDANGFVDANEWASIRTFLEQHYKRRYVIKKRFSVTADEHKMSGAPALCADCHTDRKMFGKARLTRIGSTTYNVPIDPALFLKGTTITTSINQ